jgi:small subunit ribosomal protein S20
MRRRSVDIGCHYQGGPHGSGRFSPIITARMANTQSAKKRVRASLRKRNRNRATRSAVKTLVTRARRPAVPEGNALGSEDARRAISALDKAAEKGVLHPNNASRRKSRLMAALAKTAPASEASAPKKDTSRTRSAAATGKAAPKATRGR